MAAATKFATQSRVVLAGSEKAPFSETAAHLPAAPKPSAASGKFSVTVVVRSKQPVASKTLGKAGTQMSRAAFAKAHGPDPASLKMVKAFAAEFGLTVEPVGSNASTAVHLTGSSAAMQKAFGVTLKQEKVEGGAYRVREGAIYLPESLSEHVVAVLGLDNRPQAKAHFRAATAEAWANTSYTPIQVAQLYGFPTTGANGQTIGLIELGGGYKATDIKAYFKSLGVAAPTVTAVLVDKAKNSPTNANSADGEVLLDIEVCAAVAPGAKIVVYFAPNTDQGFLDAITTAVHDQTNKPGVISISWGGPESSWTAQAMTAMDNACQAAAALGVTITVAAGDDGSTDGVSGTANHVDFPASSPHVLACGGTKLEGSGTTISSEVVWNELSANEGATGGGVSAVFALPSWQSSAGVPKPAGSSGGRGVPDVSGDADPATGYTVRVDGKTLVIGGTSAVAPLWAGLIALANAANKTNAGFINPTLYASKAKGAVRDITSGTNGGFSAGPGWDACTGLGSPNGAGLVKALAPAKAGSGTKGAKKTAKKAAAV